MIRHLSTAAGPTLRVVVLVCGASAVVAPLSPTHGSQFATRPVALPDYYTLVDVSDPALSPDGTQVAFVRTTVVEEENRRHREIWVAATDAISSPRRLTSAAHESTSPSWSPDGSLLAFNSRRGGPDTDNSPVWFLDLRRGGEAFQIEGVAGRPAFSPDGRWIAFTAEAAPTGEAAARTRSGRGRYESVPDFEARLQERFAGRIYDWMSFRFDRRGYLSDPRDPVASPPRELFVVPRSGGKARQLTHFGVDVHSFGWHPTEERLVVSADEHQRDEHSYERHDLWTVDVRGGVERLTDDGFVNRSPMYSRDGVFIIFRRAEGLDDIIAAGRPRGAMATLTRLDQDGSMHVLTAETELVPNEYFLDGAGRTLHFAAGAGGERHLFRVATGGGTVLPTTSGRRWLTDFDIAADRIAYVGSTSSSPAELYVARADGSAEVRLTRFNELLASNTLLVSARPIAFTSGDGTPIEGWVILPPGYRPDAGPYPMIVSIHGGPHGAYGERFSFQFQLWATAGHVVLYVNPRGSSGYGADFLWATWGGWGNLDTQDVIAGVEYALETYSIDAARLGVAGYSYGGFLTNWIIAHTDRFAAAVSGAGISNWISDYGTADIPRTKESEFYGPPWERRSGELLWEQSPIKHAAGISTPTLFIHGELDFRVPIEQGEQMYTALRKQEVPARFVRYPGSYHGGWAPWDMVHRYHQELRWWEEFLGNAR